MTHAAVIKHERLSSMNADVNCVKVARSRGSKEQGFSEGRGSYAVWEIITVYEIPTERRSVDCNCTLYS